MIQASPGKIGGTYTKKPGFMKRLGSRIERFASFVAPIWVAKRKSSRIMMENYAKFAAYEGARTDRLKSNWQTTDGSADQDLLPEIGTLRARSRDLNRNNSIAAGITKTFVSNVIGTGIRPQSRLDIQELDISEETASEFQKTAEKVWETWSPWADAEELLSIEEFQALAERKVREDGGVLILPLRLDLRRENPLRPFSLVLQLVEIDRLETPNEFQNSENVSGGVKKGSRGQPISYFVRKTHPGNMTVGQRRAGNDLSNFQEIPAFNKFGNRNIIHLFTPERPGQSVGAPLFSAGMRSFKDYDDYSEALIVAQRIAACFGLVIKQINPEAGFTQNSTVKTGRRIEEFYPGMQMYLNPGEEASQVKPEQPGGNFADFMKRVLRDLSAATGIPYEIVAMDYSETNYSSARAAILEARRYFQQLQMFHVNRWLQPVWSMLIEEAFLSGAFMGLETRDFTENLQEWTRAKWIPQGWAWVDPVKEGKAAADSIGNGLSTIADEAAAKGKDWEEILEQRAREEDKRKDLGLPPFTFETEQASIAASGNQGADSGLTDDTVPSEEVTEGAENG